MRIIISALMAFTTLIAGIFLAVSFACFSVGEVMSGIGFFVISGIFAFITWAATIYWPEKSGG